MRVVFWLVFWVIAIIVALLILLWRVSSTAKYAMKFLLYAALAITCATLPIPLMFFRPGNPKNALLPSALLRASSWFLGITLRVEGQENVVKDSGSVVLINHQSCLDVLVLACLWPVMDNSTVIAKREVFYIQPLGLASWLWGTIFIDRVKSKDAQAAINKTGEKIRNRKAKVMMFPEGTRHLGGTKLLPFKKGAFHLALASQVPIQPVAVGRYDFLTNSSFESGEIKIKILPAIATKGYSKDQIQELMNKSYTILSEGVDELSTERKKIN